MNTIMTIAILLILAYTGAVAAVSYSIGKDMERNEKEITCERCIHKKTCQIYDMSDCTWCEEWEGYDGE